MKQKSLRRPFGLVLVLFLIFLLPCCAPQTVVTNTASSRPAVSTAEGAYSVDTVPDFSGDAYIAINDNMPYFSESDYKTEAYESYSPLDSLGRCGTALACVCRETMPTEKRGNISKVKPSGWHSVTYDFVDGGSLYNRCHLIGFQLTAENANDRNLITGTRYLNTEGMLPFENMVADYIKETNNHVMYRVTPIFDGDDLVARGVEMEAWSVEDNGDGVCFNIYAYNNQPGVIIDYKDGSSRLDDGVSDNSKVNNTSKQTSKETSKQTSNQSSDQSSKSASAEAARKYVLNTKNKKVHLPDCESVGTIKDENKKTVRTTLSELESQGYKPCGNCLSGS